MTDILIPLGQGSRHNNLELRYALRSVEKHLSGVGNIWIVGERPDFLTNVVHVPCQDSANNWNRAWNIYRKILTGINETCYGERPFCEDITLSDNFLFMNDDHFLLAGYDLEANGFPYYHRGLIDWSVMHRGNLPQYKQYINTSKLFPAPFLDYGVHCPVSYNKGLFKDCFNEIPSKWPEFGYEIKSTYCNKGGVNGTLIDDLKFREPLMAESIYRVLEDRPWFSIGDRCLKSGDMKRVLQELYPNKSKWEL